MTDNGQPGREEEPKQLSQHGRAEQSATPSRSRRSRWIRAAAWFGFSIGMLVLIVVVLVIEALHSPRVHEYLLTLADSKASESLGVPVRIEGYALHFPDAPNLSKLQIDIHGLETSGAEPYPSPPLIAIQRVKVGIGLSIFAKNKWSLEDIQVEEPVVHLAFGPNAESNLPKLKQISSGSSSFNFFNLGIRHLVLDQGEIYYRDLKVPIEADLHDLQLRTHSDGGRNYSGTMSYRDGRFRAGKLRTIPHHLKARFEFTPTAFRLEQATLESGSSKFRLTASINNYSHPTIRGRYEAIVDAGQMRTILRSQSIPSGLIALSGKIGYKTRPGEPLLSSLDVTGDLRSPLLAATAQKMQVEVRSVTAAYALKNGDFSVQNFRAQTLGGVVNANVAVHDLFGKMRGSLEAKAQNLSLADLREVGTPASARHLALSGIIDASVKADWGKQLERTLVARVTARIHGGVSQSGGNRTPVNGHFQAVYTAQNKRLELAPSYLTLPATRITMNGSLGKHASLDFDFDCSDLARLEPIIDALRAPRPGAPPLGLSGRLSLQARMTGSIDSPRLTGDLAGSKLKARGTDWRKLNAGFEVDPSSISVTNARLEPEGGGTIDFNLRAALSKWKFSRTSPVQAELHASTLSLADLAGMVGRGENFSGTLAANLEFDGSEENPQGTGNVALSDAVIYKEPVTSANANFASAGNEIHTNLEIDLPAGVVDATADVRPEAKTYTADISAARLELAKLAAIEDRNLNVTGTLALSGSGKGSLTNPEFSMSAKIPRLAVAGQAVDDIDLEANFAGHVANATLKATEQGAPINAKATVHATGDYWMQASINTQPISLKPFLAMAAPGEAGQLHGETEIHASLSGPLKQKGLLQATVTIPRLEVGYGSKVDIAAQSPIRAEYKNWVLKIQRTELRGADVDLALEGDVPMPGHGAPAVTLQGTVNLKIAELFNPEIQSSGELRLDINRQGANENSGIEGKIELVNANVVNGNWPVGVERGNGLFLLTKDRLNIDHLTASIGGGKLTASGGIVYRPHLRFDLGMKAQGIHMLYPQGVRSEVNADLRFTGTNTNAVLGGRAEIVDLAFTPGFDFMNLASQFSGISAPPSQGFEQNLHLNLAVQSANNFELISRTMSVGGVANLEVRGTAADPVILGRISISSGDVIFNGNRYVLSGGTVEFANPNQTSPVINMGITTTIEQYNINMRLRGPVDHMRTNFSSDPALPEADIISLLAFGKTTEANPTSAATPGREAAMGAVASQVSSQITSRVSRVAGISHLSINPVLAGGTNQGPAGAVITIQQRVTGNLFVTFSTNVTSTQYQTIMGQYRISPRFSVSATRDQNGGFGVDVTLKKTW